MPAQYRSDGATATQRVYSNVNLRLFYSSFTRQRRPGRGAGDHEHRRHPDGTTVTFQATVTGDPSAGVQDVWLVWTGLGAGGHDSWQFIQLSPVGDNPNLYTGSMTAPARRDAGRRSGSSSRPSTASVSSTVADNLGAYNRVFDASAASLIPRRRSRWIRRRQSARRRHGQRRRHPEAGRQSAGRARRSRSRSAPTRPRATTDANGHRDRDLCR